jgi:hypothetical protein
LGCINDYKKRSGGAHTPDLCKKFDRLHFGIFRASEQPPGKERAERIVNRLGIIGFLYTKLCQIATSSICMLVGWFNGWMVGQKFLKYSGSMWVGDWRPSSQLRSEAKVI